MKSSGLLTNFRHFDVIQDDTTVAPKFESMKLRRNRTTLSLRVLWCLALFGSTLFSIGILWFLESSYLKSDYEARQSLKDLHSIHHPTIIHDALRLDIISVGSNKRLELLEAQKSTFGTHLSVRKFFTFVEDDDHESDCHSNLTLESTNFISQYCRNSDHRPETRKFRSRFAHINFLQKMPNPTGWFCAIKRPSESLFHVLDGYRQKRQTLLEDQVYLRADVFPDYLLLIDDDTYLNLDQITHLLPELYPFHHSYAVAGCMVRERVHEHNFTFPWGGFGAIISKALIEKALYPLHCLSMSYLKDNENSIAVAPRELTLPEFEHLACQRISQDTLGEAFLFQDGMSVVDLMYKFVTYWPYVNAEMNWKNLGGPGFCMHSDWVTGYFVNYYYLAKHTGDDYFRQHISDRLRGWQGSERYAGKESKNSKECNHDGDENCVPDAHFCHHVTPHKMQDMHSIQSQSVKKKEATGL